MKIAFVHDYIKEYGGAERVLETLHEMYPEAPVYTLVYYPDFLGPHAKRFKNWDIRPSFLQKIPFGYKLISPFRLLAPLVFPLFDLSGYDVVIVSATGAYCPNTIRTKQIAISKRSKGEKENSKNNKSYVIRHMPIHICYYHTPPRYLYGFATAREWKKNSAIRLVANVMNGWLRSVDIASASNVDIALANSQNVAARIKKFYNKESTVVYPPVNIPKVSGISHLVSSKKENKTNTSYYLAGGRLARPKHIDLIIKTCIQMGVPLRVFGKSFAGYGEELRALANNTIQFLGEVTDEEKTALLKGAKAFIFAAEDEDFGMLPVEAMGVGTPVIAYNSGGPKESIIEGKTGVFFHELSVASITDALKRFDQRKIRPEDCIQQAQKFSRKQFIAHIKELFVSI